MITKQISLVANTEQTVTFSYSGSTANRQFEDFYVINKSNTPVYVNVDDTAVLNTDESGLIPVNAGRLLNTGGTEVHLIAGANAEVEVQGVTT